MIRILYRLVAILATIALAWLIARKLPRSTPMRGAASRLSGPATILACGLGISVAGALSAELCGLGVSGGWKTETVARYFRGVFLGNPGDDSWTVLELVRQHVAGKPDAPVYQAIFFEQKHKFQYPPTSLLGWDLLQCALGWVGAARYTPLAMNMLLFHLLALAGLLSAMLLRDQWIRATGTIPTESRRATFLYLVGGIVQGFLFYPLTKSWMLGQAQTALSACAIAAILLWGRGGSFISGALVGVCCTVKPQWGVGLLWAAIRKRWEFALGLASVAGLASLAAGLAYGFGRFLEYLPVLGFLARRGEAFYPNQSVNGILNRALATADPLKWEFHAFPPYHPFVHWGTFASSALMIGFALWWGWKRNPTPIDFGISLTLFTMASPIAWEHHYGLLLGVAAASAPTILMVRPMGWATPWALGASWILVGQSFPILANLASHPFGSIAMNNLFFGSLGLVALAVAAQAQIRSSGRISPP